MNSNQIKLEVSHILESGVNEIRLCELIERISNHATKETRHAAAEIALTVGTSRTPEEAHRDIMNLKINWTSFTETGLYFTRRENPLDLIEELPSAEPLHPIWAQTMGQRDKLGSVRVTCRMCDGAGCADSVTCENGTEILPF